MLIAACQRLIATETGGDDDALDDAFGEVFDAVGMASVEEMTEAVPLFPPVLTAHPLSVVNNLLIPAVSMVQRGADLPSDLVDVLAMRVADGLERTARFPATWESMRAGAELPHHRDKAALAEAIDLTEQAAARSGYTEQQARMIVEGWFVVHHWAGALRNLLQRKDVRQNLPYRDRLVEAAGRLRDVYPPAVELGDMLAVLDDEVLFVVHERSGRGYQIRISGIGDNCQLDTLLAATLIGDRHDGLIAGSPPPPPPPPWVAAATDGDPTPDGGIMAMFYLKGPDGMPVLHEDSPADIPLVGGNRVLVLKDAFLFRPRWTVGRRYPRMLPTVSLEKILSSDEVHAIATT